MTLSFSCRQTKNARTASLKLRQRCPKQSLQLPGKSATQLCDVFWLWVHDQRHSDQSEQLVVCIADRFNGRGLTLCPIYSSLEDTEAVPSAAAQPNGHAVMTPAATAGRAYTVSIAVPGSVIDNTQTMELATAVAGQIARTAAIFKIDEVVVIDDAANREPGTVGAGAAFLARVLQFMETPQYLRRC